MLFNLQKYPPSFPFRHSFICQIKHAMALSICGFYSLQEALPIILQTMLQREDDPSYEIRPNIWVISPDEAAKIIAIPAGNGKVTTIGDTGARRSILGHADRYGTSSNSVNETTSSKESVLLQIGRYVTLEDGRIQMVRGPQNSIYMNLYDVKRLNGDVFHCIESEINLEMERHRHQSDQYACSLCNGR